MMEYEAIELEVEVDEEVEQKEVAVPKNVLTRAGLKKLPMRYLTPEGEKLRAYELDLDWEPDVFVEGAAFGAGVLVAVVTCGGALLPVASIATGAASRPWISTTRQKNRQIMSNMQTALDLEQLRKGRIIAPNTNIENLRNKNHLLVKQGNLLSIVTKEDYYRKKKYGRLSKLVEWEYSEKTFKMGYVGEFTESDDGGSSFLNGMGTLISHHKAMRLKGSWINNHMDSTDTRSELKFTSEGWNFVGKIAYGLIEGTGTVQYLEGKYTDKKGSYYEGMYSNGFPNGRGKFVINGILGESEFEGNVTTTRFKPPYEYRVNADDPDADDVIFCKDSSMLITIKKRIPKAIPSVGAEFQPVMARALTLSKYLESQRQTIIFVFNDTPCIMQRSFYKSGWGSYYIDPPLSIPPGCYASFHHESTGGASQGFFSYQLNCPESPLQVKCGFDTQFLFRKKNRFGGELLLRAHDGELPNGDGDERLLGNQVEKKTHDARVMEKDRHSGIEMHLGMNNHCTSFFCVRLQRYDPHHVTELNIPANKEDVDRLIRNEFKADEQVNFFFRR